jgi:hypothetical protein
MRKSYLHSIIFLTILVAGFYSCKKINGIDNSQVIETPYSLFFSDTAGTLFKTNDGINYKILFNPDGFECTSIITSAENVLWAKRNIYVSVNNGTNFNHAYDSLRTFTRVSCNGVPMHLNQSMMIDLPDWNMIYSITNLVHNPPTTVDYLGAEFSNNHGIRGSWGTEGSYDTGGRTGQLPVRMLSYTRLVNGVLCGLALDPDSVHFRNFYKTCAGCSWLETTAAGSGSLGPHYSDSTGVALPPSVAIPDTGFFTYGHFNNRLIAIDEHCYNGAWYSDDTGRTWNKYAGLPTGVPLICISSPFEEKCFIGTYGGGLYVLSPNYDGWQQNNNGLTPNMVIRSIAAKENIYKNGVHKRYIYLATSNGIYQSTDDGVNWVKTIPGNYVAIY